MFVIPTATLAAVMWSPMLTGPASSPREVSIIQCLGTAEIARIRNSTLMRSIYITRELLTTKVPIWTHKHKLSTKQNFDGLSLSLSLTSLFTHSYWQSLSLSLTYSSTRNQTFRYFHHTVLSFSFSLLLIWEWCVSLSFPHLQVPTTFSLHFYLTQPNVYLPNSFASSFFHSKPIFYLSTYKALFTRWSFFHYETFQFGDLMGGYKWNHLDTSFVHLSLAIISCWSNLKL